MTSIASRNKARGRAFQTKLAQMSEGMNVGTLGGEDVMHKEFSYEAKTYNKNAKTYKGKEWAGESALRLFDTSPYQTEFFVVRVKSFNFADLFMLRWRWWRKLIAGELTLYEISDATRNCEKESFVGNTYMNQAEKNCPDSKLPVVVVHTVGDRHERDIVLIRGEYWRSLLHNYAIKDVDK